VAWEEAHPLAPYIALPFLDTGWASGSGLDGLKDTEAVNVKVKRFHDVQRQKYSFNFDFKVGLEERNN